MKTAPLKKTIYSLAVLRDLTRAANRRYLEFISAIDDPTDSLDALEKISRPRRDGERSSRGFNLFDGEDLDLFIAIVRGEFNIGGLQNKHLRELLPGGDAEAYEGEPMATFDTGRRVGCDWHIPSETRTRQLSLDFERVISYDPAMGDDDQAEQDFESLADEAGVDTIFLVAPNTPAERLRQAAALSRGFLYLVSMTGVTGDAVRFSSRMAQLGEYVERVRKIAKQPLAVGFGVATPEQARGVAGLADGVIVGAAIERTVEAHLGRPDMVRQVGDFVASLVEGVKST